jgi:hypothetical protein
MSLFTFLGFNRIQRNSKKGGEFGAPELVASLVHRIALKHPIGEGFVK